MVWQYSTNQNQYNKGRFKVGCPRDGTSRCPFVPGQKKNLVPVSLCPGTRARANVLGQTLLSRPVPGPSRDFPGLDSPVAITSAQVFYWQKLINQLGPKSPLHFKKIGTIRNFLYKSLFQKTQVNFEKVFFSKNFRSFLNFFLVYNQLY